MSVAYPGCLKADTQSPRTLLRTYQLTARMLAAKA